MKNFLYNLLIFLTLAFLNSCGSSNPEINYRDTSLGITNNVLESNFTSKIIPLTDKKKLFYNAVVKFDNELYEEALQLLNEFILKHQTEINSSEIYSYTYFMLGYIYEKYFFQSENISEAELSINNYETYVSLNKHTKYIDRAYEGIARVLYLIDIDKNKNKRLYHEFNEKLPILN